MVIVEIQHSNEGSTAALHYVEENSNTAEQIYHEKLAYAAVSEVNVHSVTMLDNTGRRIKSECYYHGPLLVTE